MLEDVKGLGPKTILSLNGVGINTINDLITYYPYRYNYYRPVAITTIQDNETIVITGQIESEPKIAFIKRNLNKLSFNFKSDNILINVIIFNRAFIKQYLTVNKTITLIGKYHKQKNIFTAQDIKLTPIMNAQIESVYHLTQAIKKQSFIKIMHDALTKNEYLPSQIPDYLDRRYQFIDSLTALKYIHKPKSNNEIKQAKIRLIYEELFTFMLKINYLKIKNTTDTTAAIKKIYDEKKIKDFINTLPFTLTNDQIKALEDIEDDFQNHKRMNRLILGDVGSGKTIVAVIALYINQIAGYQGILMAPTEILAEQHYNNVIKNLNKTSKLALLTSSTKKAERTEIIKKLKAGEIDILIGTHSVLNDEIEMQNLGLVITDEQHRFGVKQRQNLQKKGSEVDVLYLSATPIPRTLALTIYGDMDISQIKTKPHSNDIITKLVKEKDIKEVLSEMLEEVKAGHQIYVVAPTIEEAEDSDLENVNELYEKLNKAWNNKIPMAILHGKLKSKEKEQIMSNFKENKIKVLISTTVIEVGIDVKNATMIIIFNAERFGLATLHQLRGRVGRNDLRSKCIIISNYETKRLKVLEESNDGFYISEKDFELRGTGDLFGIKQSGDMNFKLANLNADFKILMQCKIDSEEFLKEHLTNLDSFPRQKEIINSIAFID